jgi:hypothetical protein
LKNLDARVDAVSVNDNLAWSNSNASGIAYFMITFQVNFTQSSAAAFQIYRPTVNWITMATDAAHPHPSLPWREYSWLIVSVLLLTRPISIQSCNIADDFKGAAPFT